MTELKLHPIGVIHNESVAAIELYDPYMPALSGLKGFSHITVLWWFSEHDNEESRSTVELNKPYRKGPAVIGTFATRSPQRPNPIALTTVEVLNIDDGIIEISYIDAFDGTPVIDIKPYTPAFDIIKSPRFPNWCSHWPKNNEEAGKYNWEEEFNF